MNQTLALSNSDIFVPRQPLWVLTTNKFVKKEIMKYGISHFYTFAVDSDLYDMAQVIPDATIDLLFICRKNKPVAFAHGTFLKSYALKDTDVVERGDVVLGVRFLPGEVKLPNDFPTAELTECGIELSQIFKDQDMISRICESEDFEKKIQIFLDSYKKVYQDALYNKKSERLLSEYMSNSIIKSKGTIKIEELSEKTNFSTRYLNKVFNEKYGLSPKYYSQIIRFQYILEQIKSSEETLTNVAYDTGFFDPAHMNKQFKRFMGMTPKKYRETLIKTEIYNKIIIS